jgi:hypothetical protein
MKRAGLTLLGVFVAMCGVVSAHHGYAGFFRDRTVVIEGNLESLHYANPHVVMRIRTADDTVYTVTWQAATWVERVAGVTPTTFAAGDHLVISAAPPRDPASHELAMVREVRRPSDGWQWHRQEPRAVVTPATR